MNQDPDRHTTSEMPACNEGVGVMCRVFRTAKDLADALIEYRRLQSRLKEYE
jgi:hypothetical protein